MYVSIAIATDNYVKGIFFFKDTVFPPERKRTSFRGIYVTHPSPFVLELDIHSREEKGKTTNGGIHLYKKGYSPFLPTLLQNEIAYLLYML